MSGFAALFEGLRPPQKTRRAIRNILPEPPGGWDSPAKREDGEDVVSQHGNVLNWAVALEAYIRDTFFHDRQVSDKFEPGIARIAYTEMGMWPEGMMDYRGGTRQERDDLVPQIRSILRMLSGAHLDEIDFDLNGMTLDDMLSKFGNTGKPGDADDTEDTGRTEYRVIRVDSFEEAAKFRDMFADSNRWCIVADRTYWNRYTKRGRYTAYFLMAPDAESIPMEPGEDCPTDRYGKSLVGIMIGPDGGVEFCCVRWNHMHGGSDHEMSEKELSRMLGRPVRTMCPYVEKPSGKAEFDSIRARLNAGERPEDVFDGSRVREFGNQYSNRYGWNLTVYEMSSGSFILLDSQTMRPKWDVELKAFRPLDDTCIYAEALSGTDEYGDDICLQCLLRADGDSIVLGSNDIDCQEDSLLDEEVVDVTSIGLPHLYLAEIGYRDNGDTQILVNSDFTRVSSFHRRISVREDDKLICCDIDSSEYVTDFDTVDGCPEVISYADGQFREILGMRRYTEGDLKSLAYIYPSRSKASLVYLLDATLYALIDGKERKLHDDCESMTMLPPRYGSLVHVIPYGGNELLFDLSTGKFTMDNLTKCSDTEGIISMDSGHGTKNILGPDGKPLFDTGWADIKIQLNIDSPMSCAMPEHQVLECTDKSGNTFLFDWPSGKPIYDRPMDGKCYPYTHDLYISNEGEQYVIRSSEDDSKRSVEFDGIFQPMLFHGTVLKMNRSGHDRFLIYDIAEQSPLSSSWMDDEPDAMMHTVWPGVKSILAEKTRKSGFNAGTDEQPKLFIIQYGRNHQQIAAFDGISWVVSPLEPVLAIKEAVRYFGQSSIVWVLTDDKEYKLYDLGVNEYIPVSGAELLPALTSMCNHFDPENRLGDTPTGKRLMACMELAGKESGSWVEWIKGRFSGGDNG